MLASELTDDDNDRCDRVGRLMRPGLTLTVEINWARSWIAFSLYSICIILSKSRLGYRQSLLETGRRVRPPHVVRLSLLRCVNMVPRASQSSTPTKFRPVSQMP